VNRMFQRCLDDGQYRQALGLALETHRMDIFEKAIVESVSGCFLCNQHSVKAA
jgi:26S proteasome regulatory subunit N2